ncbi:MAG: GerAB/ArcD/ProY family transporter [Clostridiales bacterium]|nr:GerAB/ArcD/ProY family transporter [Candidatus Apopatousia equi]
MKELSSRQAGLLIFITTCAMKLLVLPSLIISKTGNSIWLTLLIMFAIDIAIIFIFLSVLKQFPNLTFKELCETCLGKIFTKVVFFLLGVLLCFKVSMLIRETYEFYTETSYVDFDWLVYLIPLVLIASYASSKRLRALGRASEIFIYFIGISLVMALLFSFGSADFLSFMPLLKTGISPVFNACFDYAFWFGDFILLFFFLGNIKVDKNTQKYIIISYIVAIFIVFILSVLHYAIYGSMSTMYKTTIVDITEYIPRLNTTGRFTWIIILLWPISLVFSICTYMNMAVKSFENCFEIEKDNSKYVGYCSIALAVAILIAVNFSQINFMVFIQNYFKYFVFVVQYILPPFLPLLLVYYSKKETLKHEKKSLEK